MKRRHFISRTAIQGIGLTSLGPLFNIGEKRDQTNYGTSSGKEQITKIGQWSLQDIRDIFYNEFYQNNLPIWRNQVVDREYGGYIPYTRPYYDAAGKLVFTDKRLYHQGRCFWLYSYLYNHVEKDAFYLKAASQGYDFLLKNAYDEQTSLWAQRLNRQGEILIPFGDILACIYMFLGLGEYYKATGDETVAGIASKSAHAIIKVLTAADYQAEGMGPRPALYESFREPGTRRLGLWMHFLSALTPFLKYKTDPSLEMVARFCVRNMLEKHYDKDLRFAYEFLQSDYSPYPKNYHTHETMRVADGFHSVETSWMSMDEALRTGNYHMFMDAMTLGRDVMEMLWLERDGQQGLVRYYWPDDDDPMARAKILEPYVMNEVWVMLLLGMEHTPEPWLIEWMDKSFTYSYKDGKLDWPYGETLHHPRGLLFCLQILDRMIARSGLKSDFLEVSQKPEVKINYR
ncbi:MAG: hypothetical protein HKN76_06760 [Saprospiraceae bacterium]|nr:hypothetical protein [Saprospiraceae bacterium]